MKRSTIVSQVVGPVLLLAMIGCSGPVDTVQTDEAPATTSEATTDEAVTDTVPGDGEGVTLVSLKVPNMH